MPAPNRNGHSATASPATRKIIKAKPRQRELDPAEQYDFYEDGQTSLYGGRPIALLPPADELTELDGGGDEEHEVEEEPLPAPPPRMKARPPIRRDPLDCDEPISLPPVDERPEEEPQPDPASVAPAEVDDDELVSDDEWREERARYHAIADRRLQEAQEVDRIKKAEETRQTYWLQLMAPEELLPEYQRRMLRLHQFQQRMYRDDQRLAARNRQEPPRPPRVKPCESMPAEMIENRLLALREMVRHLSVHSPPWGLTLQAILPWRLYGRREPHNTAMLAITRAAHDLGLPGVSILPASQADDQEMLAKFPAAKQRAPQDDGDFPDDQPPPMDAPADDADDMPARVPPPTKADPADIRVVAVIQRLEEMGSATAGQLRKATKMNGTRMTKTLAAMVATGAVIQTGTQYSVPPGE